ncbi:MAG: motility protein A [Acidimicrobiales bacterium]|nr:motility protein A [Acidimicrobiales bacterium]
MDPMTAVGIVLAIAATFVAMTMGGINFAAVFFVDIGSIILVFGGALGATVASGTMADAIGAGKVIVKALAAPKPPEAASTIKQLLGFAETARKEGLLALESAAKEIQDPFLKKGIEMSVDGTDPEVVREVLETEISSIEARHKAGAGFWMKMAGYAPSFGVAGTVIGLIDMLNHLNDPSALGPALAVAFATTLWGAFLANYIFTPIALKLQRTSELEVAYKELVLEGIISIQAGSSPRAVADRLAAYLTPAEQLTLQDKKSA